ncbi:MAG: NAD-dependent epimerase/dehydratase family protein [Candidatus Riflebacteria bacterium]|nr:NAD-dependent epimerase/dehydratase family protein [Candidatus Riflebacteria bacterium]
MRELTKVLVTGASGFVGVAVQEELRKGFHPVLAYLRRSSDPQAACRLGSLVMRGDITDRVALRKAFEWKPQAVVHLVGLIEERGDNTFGKVHIDGTTTVVDLCKEFQIQKLVHMSALGTRADAVSEYHKTKFHAEEIVTRSGVPYTILRPSIIFGKRSEFLVMLDVLVSVVWITPVLGSGQWKVQPVWVRDVARIVAQSLSDERTDGQVYEIGGPDVLTLDQMLQCLERRQGRQKSHVHLSETLGAWMAWGLELPGVARLVNWVHDHIRPVPRVTRDQLLMMQEDSIADPTRVRETFRFELTRFESWLDSEEYASKPYRPWKGRWLTSNSAGSVRPPA